MHLVFIAGLALGLASAAPYNSHPVELPPQDVPSTTTREPSTTGAYEIEMPSSTTPAADVPVPTTTQAYGNYEEEITSTPAADVPSTTVSTTTEEAYGSYPSSTTPAFDEPSSTITTTTTTMEPVPSTSDSYGYSSSSSTTPAADVPSTTLPTTTTTEQAYGNYGEEVTSSTPATDVPSTTTTSTTTEEAYGSYPSSTPALDVPTSTSTTTMEPVPSTSDSYGYSSSSSTTPAADVPSTTTEQQTYGNYGEEIPTSTQPAADEPSSTLPPYTQTSSSAYGDAYSGEQPVAASLRAMDAPVAESSGQFPWNDGGDVCVGRPDGLYELSACSAQFLTCSGEVARIMDCPFGLVYNTPIEACDYPHEVASCGEGSGAAADMPVESSSTTEMPQTTPRVITECAEGGAAVGIESATCIHDSKTSLSPCSPHFEMCLSGRLYTLSCGAESVFLSTGRCASRSDAEAMAECNLQEQQQQQLDSITSSAPYSASTESLPSSTTQMTSY